MPSIILIPGGGYSPTLLDQAAKICAALGRGDLLLAPQTKKNR